jgi:hypothetical protein
MNKFILPWLRKQKIQCPKCNGIIEIYPLLPGQENSLNDLEEEICHKINPQLLYLLPKLSEADRRSREVWISYGHEFPHMVKNWKINLKYLTKEEQTENTIALVKYGIFPLIDVLSFTELIALFLLWCLEDKVTVKPIWLVDVIGLSRARISGILKTLKLWAQVTVYYCPSAKPKARGRQRTYSISDSARKILNDDFKDYLFLREFVKNYIWPFIKSKPNYPWRKDLLVEDNHVSR